MTATMTAAVLYGQDDLRIERVPMPEVRAGEVLVQVMVTGICGSDLPRVLGTTAHHYPIILGHEFSGTVAEVGAGVTGVTVGDCVAGVPLLPCHTCRDCQLGNFAHCKRYSFIGSRVSGSWAEYVTLPATNVVKLPDGVGFEQGAFIEPSTVALHALRHIQFQGGADVAILGGGNIGLLVLQWARLMGARSTTVFDIDDERLKTAKRLGADYTVNMKSQDYTDAGQSLTDGRGYGVVFETAGAVAAMKASFELAGTKAKVCFVGTPTTDIAFSPKLFELMNRKSFTLTGSWMSYSSPFPGDEWDLSVRCLENGQLNVLDTVYRTFRLPEINQAFDQYKRGQVKGKVLLRC